MYFKNNKFSRGDSDESLNSRVGKLRNFEILYNKK